MKIIKNILFPTQFTHYSLDLLEYVFLFARSLHARLHLLHVISRGETAPSFDELNEFFLEVSGDHGEAFTRTVLDQVDLLKVHVKDSDVAHGICQYATSAEIDLVMMAARSPEMEKDATLGHVARSVLENSPCPVMIVRLPEERRQHQSRFEMTLQEIKKEIATHR